MKKKVLIFLQNGVGGAERMSVLFGKSLSLNNYDVKFCLVGNAVRATIEDFIPDTYSTISISRTGPLKMMRKLVGVIRKEHPQIVFSSVMYLNTKILPFRYCFPNIRFVIRCENYLYTFNIKQRYFIRLSYRYADEIIVQTEEMRDELIDQMHINGDKIKVIYNPIDIELIDRLVKEGCNPYHNSKKHIVAVGRFAYQKGFDLLVKAFHEITKRRPDVELYIVGDNNYGGGDYYQEVMELAHRFCIDEYVHCVGYQKNPYIYIKYADCFVLSSRWEGMPNVLNEALYLGIPVAAFKCVPIVERMVKDGINGFLAEKESVRSLVDAMQKALSLDKMKTNYNINYTFEL